MGKDHRSNKIIVITHCILNQNARIGGCANYKGAIPEIITLLVKKGYGILQMPCPEMAVMDFKRSHRTKQKPYIKDILRLPRGRKICRELSQYIATQILDYQKNGFKIPVVLGKDGSPSCGVLRTTEQGQQAPGKGVFIEELQKVFKERRIKVPIIGMADDNKEQIKEITTWLKKNLA